MNLFTNSVIEDQLRRNAGFCTTNLILFLVIGAVTRKEVYSNGENCFKNYVETVIYRNNTNERLKSLATPNIILTDEPNYVIVDVYTSKG